MLSSTELTFEFAGITLTVTPSVIKHLLCQEWKGITATGALTDNLTNFNCIYFVQ